jgi:citrate synthase
MLTHLGMSDSVDALVNSGLEGVVAAPTDLSEVDGERGAVIVGGYPIDELAQHATFEETTWLLWHGELPPSGDLAAFRQALADHSPAVRVHRAARPQVDGRRRSALSTTPRCAPWIC